MAVTGGRLARPAVRPNRAARVPFHAEVAHAGAIGVGRAPRSTRSGGRQRRALIRVVPLIIIAALAFAAGILVATGPGKAERRLVTRYVAAWEHQNFAQMYSLLDPQSRRSLSPDRFIAAYQKAAATATLVAVTPLHVNSRTGDYVPVRMRVRTRVFGTLDEMLQVPLAGSGSGAKVKFDHTLLFPGLKPGEKLRRHTHLAPRATLLASNGAPLAKGPDRTSPIPTVAGEIV